MANLIVLAAYLLGILALGVYLSRYVRRDEDYFLAGRSLNMWVVAGTVMATNVAAIYLVGPAGAAYKSGTPALLIAWTGNMIAAVSALVYVPRLRRLRLTTISEFLEQRYGLWLRILVTVWWVLYYSLFAGNAMYTFANSLQPVLQESGLQLGIGTIILLVGLFVTLYCFVAGLLAVVYTDVIQAFVIVLGGVVLLPLALKAVGGVSGLAAMPAEKFVFWKAGDAWPTWKDVVMFTLLGLPYWCTSQYMLQRSFAGKSVRHASRGLALAALLTGVLTLSYILPGICGHRLLGGEQLDNADRVLPKLFLGLLPLGLGGLFIAALVAASNSTASSLTNSLATLAENDVYRRFLPGRTPRHYTWIGRLVTLAAGGVGVIFAFNVEALGGIIRANYQIMSFFEPPIFVIVAAALLWRRANVSGAGAVIVCAVAYSAYTLVVGTDMGVRTMVAFPLYAAAMFAGSLLGSAARPAGADARQRVNELFRRMRGPRVRFDSAEARIGLLLAALSLAGFVACAFGEAWLPKPANILIFMGLMMAFVGGCYVAIPMFVPEEAEALEAPAAGGVERSWVNRIFGSGWTWLAMYAAAAVLMVVLYLVGKEKLAP